MWNELPEEFPENLESTYHQMLAHDSFRVVIKPLIYSLHRWSLEEDVTLLLRAAAVMASIGMSYFYGERTNEIKTTKVSFERFYFGTPFYSHPAKFLPMDPTSFHNKMNE